MRPYAPGTEFAIEQITMVGNTGTYLDAPYHRFPDGPDLAAIPLARTADLPAAVIRSRRHAAAGDQRGRPCSRGRPRESGAAPHRHDARFGTRQYAADGHFLTRDGAVWLAGHDPALVGIDAANIDDTEDGERPAHTLLLAAGIPVI